MKGKWSTCATGTGIFLVATILTGLLLGRRWSHSWGLRLFGVPTLQQELNLFSENAFYYSFYKEVLDARSLPEAVRALRRDDRTEHPEVIDALARFNVLQELLLGAAYRLFPPLVKKYVGRFAFYAGSMLSLNALGSGVLCTLTWYLSGCDVACAAAEFGLFIAMLLVPISRAIGVHVAALRENFALPLLHVQTAWLVVLLRRDAEGGTGDRRNVWTIVHLLGFSFLTTLLLFFWQFSGFLLCAQAGALFVASLVGRSCRRGFVIQVLLAQALALGLQAAAMPGGAAAALAPAPEVLGAAAMTLLMRPYARFCQRRSPGNWKGGTGGATESSSTPGPCTALVSLAYAAVAFLALRALRESLALGKVKLTEHVDELLLEKLHTALQLGLRPTARLLQPLWPAGSEQLLSLLDRLPAPKPSFDAAVYLEQDEFRALWDPGVFERHVLAGGWNVKTPLAVASSSGLLVAFIVALVFCLGTSMPPAELVFLTALALIYAGLTAIVWRLRVLSLPLLAVLGAQALSPRLWAMACPCCTGTRRRGLTAPSSLRTLRWVAALSCLALSSGYLGKLNSFYDQGLNPDTEREDRRAQFKMFRWIQKHGTAEERMVLAGDATTMASARLALPAAAIVAHPHYEHPRSRQRFKEAKEFFLACGPAREAHKYATRLGVTHLLLDLTRLAPQQAISLSRFYKKSMRCGENMGSDLLGMGRTVFQILLGAEELFRPLHLAGSYALVQVLQQSGSRGDSQHGAQATRVDPGSPSSWAGLLDRCPQTEKEESCVEDLGLFIRSIADPLRQHNWVRAMAADAVQRYPGSALLEALLGRTFDYDLSDFSEAAKHYRRATELQPTSPQYLSALGSLLTQVWGGKAADEIRDLMARQAPILLGTPPGPGLRDMSAQRLCQAAAWSRSLGLKGTWEAAFWQTAKLRARFGCLLDQWALMEGQPRPWWELALDFLRFAD